MSQEAWVPEVDDYYVSDDEEDSAPEYEEEDFRDQEESLSDHKEDDIIEAPQRTATPTLDVSVTVSGDTLQQSVSNKFVRLEDTPGGAQGVEQAFPPRREPWVIHLSLLERA